MLGINCLYVYVGFFCVFLFSIQNKENTNEPCALPTLTQTNTTEVGFTMYREVNRWQ